MAMGWFGLGWTCRRKLLEEHEGEAAEDRAPGSGRKEGLFEGEGP